MATSFNPAMVLSAFQDVDCGHIAVPDKFNFAVSILLVIGILVSYLPQHIKIVQKGTSAGLAPLFIFLGSVSSVLAFANIISQPSTRNDVLCCRKIDAMACTSAVLGIVQIGIMWTCFTILMLLFVAYFPHHVADDLDEPRGKDLPDPRSRTFVWLVSLLTFIVIFAITAIILTLYPGLSYSWANILGIGSSILSTIQYFPQIWTTWKLKRVYSLSILMMCIQVPGAFLFAYSLGARVGWSGWSTWLVYVITGFLQGVLLVMALYYRTEEARASDASDERQPTERDPLLAPNQDTANPTHNAVGPRK